MTRLDRDVAVSGAVLHAQAEGPPDAPALILLHALGSSLSLFDQQMPSLVRRFRVIRFDSRGHGASRLKGAAKPLAMKTLARDALAVLDAFEVKRAHALGLSLGGAVCQQMLIDAPERVERAVIANSAAWFGPREGWDARIREAQEKGLEGLAAAAMDRWFTPDFRELSPGIVAAAAQTFRETDPAAYAATVAALRDFDLREAIREVKARVLVLVGKRDPATPPALGGLIAEHIAGARLVALDAAHLSNVEAPNDFTRAIISFLTAP
jgi:3-oxoadipate enol-lactonase